MRINIGHKNIILIGYRCSGKTEVGKILSEKLQRTFIDTDIMVEERAGCTIDNIVSNKGWDHFRHLERLTVEAISQQTRLVIATGGGVVMDDTNLKNLKVNGYIVWLKGDPKVLKERMVTSETYGHFRPSLTDTDPLEEIQNVLTTRIPFYRKAGDLEVDTGSLSIDEVADSVLKKLGV